MDIHRCTKPATPTTLKWWNYCCSMELTSMPWPNTNGRLCIQQPSGPMLNAVLFFCNMVPMSMHCRMDVSFNLSKAFPDIEYENYLISPNSSACCRDAVKLQEHGHSAVNWPQHRWYYSQQFWWNCNANCTQNWHDASYFCDGTRCLFRGNGSYWLIDLI